MKNYIRNVAAALVSATALCSPTLISAGETLDRVTSTGVLTMATDANLNPISFLNDNNEMDGFDVDVGKEIAKRMGVELKIVTPEWTVITAGKWVGRWDVSVGSMTPTAARAEVLDFPAVYYFTPASFIVHNDSDIKTKAELNNRIIGVPAGTSYESYMNQNLVMDAAGTPPFTYDVKASELKTLSTSTALMDDLRLGAGVRLDAILYSLPGIMEAIKNGYPFRVVGEPAFYEPLAIATDKGDAEFNAKIAETIEAMKADGTMTTLSMKWFNVDYTKN